jgi:hypothetical protein
MIPGFIVDPRPHHEEASPPSRRYGGRGFVRLANNTRYVPQENTFRPPDDPGVPMTSPASAQCPGCYTYRCGLFGLSTCLLCC